MCPVKPQVLTIRSFTDEVHLTPSLKALKYKSLTPKMLARQGLMKRHFQIGYRFV